MTRLEALVSLNMVGDIGSIRLKKLLEFFGTPENILRARQDQLVAVAGIGENAASRICALKHKELDKEFKSADKLGLKIITADEPTYPQNLKNIYDPPIVLYVKGEIKKEDGISLGIVGSRRASFYGLTNAEKFAYELSQRGFTIVSGMARGVDTAAHRGALQARGRTLAVMGSGFNRLYPAENKELAQEIAKNGAVISEFPINTEPFRQNFPRRNRVISGLSLGVLVVEAARNSGALISADFALEQGREVFALPGKVDSGTSFGTNGLIKQGAKLVCDVEDIVEEFNGIASCGSPCLPVGKAGLPAGRPRASKEINSRCDTRYAVPNLSAMETALYNALSAQPLSLDEIVEKTNMNVSGVADMLLKLQLRRLIRQLPGKQFARRDNAG